MISRIALFGALVLVVFSIIYSFASTIALESRTQKIEDMIAEYEKKFQSAMQEHQDMRNRLNTLWLDAMHREMMESDMTDKQKAFFYE